MNIKLNGDLALTQYHCAQYLKTVRYCMPKVISGRPLKPSLSRKVEMVSIRKSVLATTLLTLLALTGLAWPGTATPAVLTVLNTNDAGAGSLRQAI
jgi:hypothetical protein